MTPEQFWQNFSLGQEQEIVCNFIYDALRNLHEMDTLSLETEVFPVLYNLSIGLERLLKICVVLLEFDENTEINSFEESLITHNHIDLVNRIKNKAQLKLGSAHNDLLILLTKFYKTYRYGRYTLQSVRTISDDKKSLHNYLNKHLGINIDDDNNLFGLGNSNQIKKFIGKAVLKITSQLRQIILDMSRQKNIFTHEISRSDSKAGKILYSRESITFENEEIATVEALRFLIDNHESPRLDFLREINPLPLDPALIPEYLKVLVGKKPSSNSQLIDEVEAHYEDVDNIGERIEIINNFKDPQAYFEDVQGGGLEEN